MTDSLPTSTDPLTRTTPTLKAARQAKGITQQELATTLGLSIGTIREWEQGTRTTMYTKNWNKLCDLLEVDTDTGFHGLSRVFNH